MGGNTSLALIENSRLLIDLRASSTFGFSATIPFSRPVAFSNHFNNLALKHCFGDESIRRRIMPLN
jgi:hypothetical protein